MDSDVAGNPYGRRQQQSDTGDDKEQNNKANNCQLNNFHGATNP